MPWPFVGRTEHIARITAILGTTESQPIVVSGESGVGRTSLVSQAIRIADPKNRTTIRITPKGPTPFAALRPFVRPSPDTCLDVQVTQAAAELTRLAGHGRLVAVVDDAHLADHASLLALRVLSRAGQAQLIVTRPDDTDQVRAPDPTDCLRYEHGTTSLHLAPLTRDEVAELLDDVVGDHVHAATVAALHAASGGNPRALRELVVAGKLFDCLVARSGGWRLRPPSGQLPAPLSGDAADRLVTATERAWRSLAMAQVEELCQLAGWRGTLDRVTPIWATVSLLRGQPERGLRALDTIAVVEPHVILVRAIALALGLHRPDAAADYLTKTSNELPALRRRLSAYRAWLLAIAGQAVDVPAACGDRETAAFCGAAHATLALTAGRPAAAVGHLRRALAAAEGCRAELPWLPCLIDALLLAGRIREATGTATEFHAGKAGNGWDVAVVFAALASQTMAALTVRAITEGMTTA